MPGFELPVLVVFFGLLILAVPTVLPIITGFVCTRRTSWISPRFGFFVGLGAALVGSTILLGSAYFGVELREGDSIPPPLFFSGLAATVIIQNVAVVGVCLFVNRRRDRSWGIRRW